MRQIFAYKARNLDGKIIKGSKEAQDEESLARILIEEGLSPVVIEPAEKTSFWKKDLNIQLIPQKVTSKDLHLFCRQMYTMTRSGIPMTNALKRLSESTRNTTLQKALLGMYDMVASGNTISDAMQKFPKVFPSLLRHIVTVGERTGRLEEAFLQVGDYLNLEVKTLAQLKSIMRYPVIVISAIFVAIMVVNIFVIPAFSDLFKNFNAELPIFTRILIGFSEFVRGWWWAVIIAFIAMLMSLRYFFRSNSGEYIWHYYQTKIFAVGPILRRILYARFARTLMMILRTGVPITDGIELVSSSVGNAYFQNKIMKMKEVMESGENLTTAAQEIDIFPTMMIQMMVVGEESGNLDQMMEEVAGFYEREIDYEIDKLGDVIEPLLLAIIGALVLMLALGVFLPIWELGAAAQGR